MAIKKNVAITIEGTVIYCDRCGAQGPSAAYENAEDVLDEARANGWHTDGDEHDHGDLCPECVAKTEPPHA